MTMYRERIRFSTRGELDVVDITEEVRAIVKRSGIKEGFALIFAPHATGAIILNENDPDLLEDIRWWLSHVVPLREYKHPINARSHLRSILMAPSKVVPVLGGDLYLGTWQSVMWVEVDTRPRRREVLVMVFGESQ